MPIALITRLRLALLSLYCLSYATGCVTNEWPDEVDGCHAPNTDALAEQAIERWEAVTGEPVAPDFRGTLLWELVEGGTDQWHPSCAAAEDPATLAGCTTWDRAAWVFHVQLRWCMSRAQTERVAYHELGHALARHHYGDIDPEHKRVEVWVDVVGHLQEGIE